jgi:3D (Asp-Asp-Asp) domain-containing protein
MQHSIHTDARRRRKILLCKAAGNIRAGFVRSVTLGLLLAVGVVGFDVAGADSANSGGVVASGAAPALGSAPGEAITGMARTPSGQGYWLATGRGAVFAFGDAPFAGSLNATGGAPVVDIAAAPDGQGYWLVESDGAITAFGSARPLGAANGAPLNQPVVGMAATPSGGGYWLVARDGGIFAFGDATFHGSTGSVRLNQPIVGMASSPTGQGYWLVARDGGIFSFGDARFAGSAGSIKLNEPIVGMAPTPSGNGYWLAARDGGVFTYGDATFHGSLAGIGAGPVVDIDRTPGGDGQWLATGGRYLGEFEVTCYALRGQTASGKPVGRHVVAVDPRVVPLGTEIFIGGEGTRSALDTGGNIKGNRLDVWRSSSDQCREFGRKTLPVFSPT